MSHMLTTLCGRVCVWELRAFNSNFFFSAVGFNLVKLIEGFQGSLCLNARIFFLLSCF